MQVANGVVLDVKTVLQVKKQKARLKDLLAGLDDAKTGQTDFQAFLTLAKQLKIVFDPVDQAHLERAYVRRGLIAYQPALKGLYLFHEKKSGELKWGVQSVPNRESVSQELERFPAPKVPKKKRLASQIEAEISKLHHSMVMPDEGRLTPPRRPHLEKPLTPPRPNPSTGGNPAYNVPRNIALAHSLSGQKPKRNYYKLCQVLAQHEVTFADLQAIKDIFKQNQRATGSAFISPKAFRQALPDKFPDSFIEKITPLLEAQGGEISYALFLELLNDLMGSASAMKLLGNSSVKMKEVLAPNNEAFLLGKDSKLLAYVQFRIDERYRTNAQAFKAFDKDHDGLLNYSEFKEGLWDLGIRCGAPEVLRIYDHLEQVPNKGGIDLKEFYQLAGSPEKPTQHASPPPAASLAAPRSPSEEPLVGRSSEQSPSVQQRVGELMISRSRDPNNFNKDVQNQMSGIARLWRGKMQYQLPSDRNADHRYGSPLGPHVNFSHLMSHQFEKEFSHSHRQKLEDLLRQDAEKLKVSHAH